ncbi:hypothetical protein GCM10027217_31110 [Pseudomaricurvus hydrocarbonicus]
MWLGECVGPRSPGGGDKYKDSCVLYTTVCGTYLCTGECLGHYDDGERLNWPPSSLGGFTPITLSKAMGWRPGFKFAQKNMGFSF